MKNRTIFAVMLLTAAALGLTGCEQARPAEETRMEQPTTTIAPTAIPDAGTDEPEVELIALNEPEEIPAPAQVLSEQEISPPTKNTEPVAERTARPTDTNRTVEKAAPAATPKPTAEPTPHVAADAAPAATPEPAATAAPTTTPKPTASPKATATPKPTTVPQATAVPAVTATPKPTVTPARISTPKPAPTPTPVPTATPHVHSWTRHEATGHYESRKTGTEEVAVGTYWEEIGGWDEDRAAYYRCNDCGAEFSSNLAAGEHIIDAYHGSYSYYPAETVHHDGEWVEQTRYEIRDVYKDVWITDSEAYWTCACGETRYSQP